MTDRIRRAALALLLAGGLSACSDQADDVTTLEPSLSSSTAVARLVACPTKASFEGSGTILPTGGVVTVRRHSVVAPAGAVASPTTIRIRESASKHVRIDLTANGQMHWQFSAPVLVTISYARCNRNNLARSTPRVWLLDDQGRPIQNMGGVHDRLARTITFTTDHFSGYAIAN